MLQIYLFGNLRLLISGQPHRFQALPKCSPLLIYLLLKRHEPVSRSALAFLLWPDVDESEAKSNLRRHLHDLKRALPPEAPDAPWLLVDTTTVQWNPQAAYWLDVAAFEAAAQRPEQWDAAIDLYTDDLATSFYEDWLFFERERLRVRFLDILTQLTLQAQRRQDYARAITYAQRILQHDPMREDILRTLMTLRFESGDRPGALQEYQRFEQRLREELGVAPMVETNALYDAIARQIAPPAAPPHASPQTPPYAPPQAPFGLPAVPAPEPELEARYNLPAQLTSFIGREAELASLRGLLTAPQPAVRLLTLTGPGGCGKSRLALEVGARIHSEHPDNYPDGILFIPLSPLTDAGQVPSALAQTLGVRETSPATLLPSLKAALHARRMLLIVDNFEHVTAAAPLLVELLEAAPRLVMLVTSRAVLHVYGEQEFPLQPLPLPESEATVLRTEDLARYASVALFTTRSRAVRPSFVLNQENATAVAEICRRLDGLPLAIELAAARSKLLAPHALLDRLRSGFAILADHNRQVPLRHQTLAATLEWSYQLLAPREKQLFAHVAVFAGTFALDAAEEVCGAATDTLAAIEGLIDSSLLQQIEVDIVILGASEPAYYDELRFRMLSVVHEYAMQRLYDSGESATVHRRHALYFLRLAETAEPQLRKADQGWWQQRLEVEQLNFRSALRFCLDGDESDVIIGMRIAAALAQFWLFSGSLAEANRWLSASLAAGASAPPLVRARALTALGMTLHAQGDMRPAQPLLEEALELFRTAGDNFGVVVCLYGLGRLAARLDTFDTTRRFLGEALTLAQTTGQHGFIPYILNILAAITSEEQNFAEASVLYGEALAAARRAQNKSQIAWILTGSGEMARLQQDYVRAAAHYTEAMRLARELRQKPRIVMLLHNLGHIALHNGDAQRALRLFREAVVLGMELPDKENLGMCLIGIGAVAAAQGDPARAARLFGAGEMVLDSIGARLAAADQMEYDRHRAAVECALSESQYTTFHAAGYSLTLEQAEHLART